jgi:hypothetical protein
MVGSFLSQDAALCGAAFSAIPSPATKRRRPQAITSARNNSMTDFYSFYYGSQSIPLEQTVAHLAPGLRLENCFLSGIPGSLSGFNRILPC